MKFAALCTPVKIFSKAEYCVLQVLQFQEISFRRILSGGIGMSHNLPNQSFANLTFNICI
jgi:hypothetical protein